MREHRQRLDKWLWFARFVRTRTSAVQLVEEGHVRVEGRRVESPAHGLKCGDVLTLALPHATIVVRILAFAERRGPFETAKLLYERLDQGKEDPSLAVPDDED